MQNLQQVSLLATLVLSLGFGLLFGLLAHKLKLPALVGYLLAGILVGPASRGWVTDLALSAQLAEIGVILLMFGVGLHFSLKDILSLKSIVVPGSLITLSILSFLGSLCGRSWGWPWSQSLIFGLSLSIASTVVLMRSLESRGQLKSVNGQIAVGWGIIEDLVAVLLLVLLPVLMPFILGGTVNVNSNAGQVINSFGDTQVGLSFWGMGKVLLLVLLKMSLFFVLMLWLGRKLFPWLLWQIAKTGSRELFTLAVIALAIGLAYGASSLFGVSFSLGAFFAGLVMRESHLSQRAAEESLPLRDAFSVLFFVSVGMLLDPTIFTEQPLRVLIVTALIIVGKMGIVTTLIVLFKYPLSTGLIVGAGIAQVGEFSFILLGLSSSLGLIQSEVQSLVLSASLISISLNHIVYWSAGPILQGLKKHSRLARRLEYPIDPLAKLPASIKPSELKGHIVLVGYGRVGQCIGEELSQKKMGFVVAEQNRGIVETLRARGWRAVAGDASDPAVLIQAHIARARVVLIAIDDRVATGKILEVTRLLQPKASVLVRCHDKDDLTRLPLTAKIYPLWMESELAKSMVKQTLELLQAEAEGTAKHN